MTFPLVGVYSREIKAYVYVKTHTRVFMATLTGLVSHPRWTVGKLFSGSIAFSFQNSHEKPGVCAGSIVTLPFCVVLRGDLGRKEDGQLVLARERGLFS